MMNIKNILVNLRSMINSNWPHRAGHSIVRGCLLLTIALSGQLESHANEVPYSNYVGGNTYQEDSSQLLTFIDENFYSSEGNQKVLDIRKMRQLQERVKAKHEQLLDSFQQSAKIESINRHQFSNKKSDRRAVKRTGKEARVNLPFIVFDERLEDFIGNHIRLSADQIRNELSTLMIYYQAIEAYDNENLYQIALESVKSLLPPWYDVPKQSSPEQEALNLLENGQFLSTEQLREKYQKHTDISLLNPPSSAFWSDNDIESFDPNSEEFLGEQFFPEPNTEMVYDRMGTGQIKIKADFYPVGTEDVCNTDLDNGNVTLRLGQETQNQLIATQLARSVGYPRDTTCLSPNSEIASM